MRRYLTLFLGFVLAAALLAFAAQAKTTRPSATTVSLSGWSAGADEDALLRQVIKKFEQTHPSIKVDYSVINGDYPTAMTARFAAHNPPDVFYVDSSLASTWADQGVLQPLNSYVAESKYDTAKFFPSLLGAFKVGQPDLRLPEGLVAARDGDQHRHARRRQAEGAEDVGRPAVGRAEARVVERRAGRQADLPLARLGAPAGVRLPVRRIALRTCSRPP